MAQISRRPSDHLTSTQNVVDVQYSANYKYTEWLELLKLLFPSTKKSENPYQITRIF